MEWSTWQQESGQWTVSVDVELGEDAQANLPRGVMFPARWNFNPANQSIYASNEAAYFLMGRDHSHDAPIPGPTKQVAAHQEGSAEEASEQAAPAPVGVQVAEPRLTRVSVPEQKEQNELLDELTARRGVRSFDPASERKLADLLERARRSSRPAPRPRCRAEPAPEAEEPVASVVDETAQPQTAASENTVEQQAPDEATENSAESPAALEEAPCPPRLQVLRAPCLMSRFRELRARPSLRSLRVKTTLRMLMLPSPRLQKMPLRRRPSR